MRQSPDLNAVMTECRKFPESFESLHLATCNAEGEPEASYAAYVEQDGCYYIYVSELSVHAANLATTKRCSVLFIESEADAKHLFARRRLTLYCSATESDRDSPEFDALMDKFVDKFGSFMSMLRKLSDFHLYQLRPQSGAFVAGFAQAFTLGGEGLNEITHRKEQGHRSPDKTTAAVMDTVA